jgi:hypothetical protein
MVMQPFCVAAILALLLICPARPAGAQNLASSFEQLQVLVKPGDTITVTDRAGRELRGKIASLSSSSLALLVEGARYDLPESGIRTIRQRRQDSLANGAKWGLGIGAGLGVAAGVAVASGHESTGALIPILAMVYGGIGAGVGVGIDALVLGNQVIYFKPAASSAKLSVSPLVTPRRRGVFLSVGF